MNWTHCISAFSLAGLISATAAKADFIISHEDIPAGQSDVVFELAGATIHVTSHGGDFASYNIASTRGIGVSGGRVPGAIDGEQSILFTFDRPVAVTALTIAHLYTAGNSVHAQNEVARFVTDHGAYDLEATDETAGTWTGDGSLENLSPGRPGRGGVWNVGGTDIFSAPITFLRLTSGNPGHHVHFGEYSFVSLAATPIPAPACIAVMIGLLPLTRRRRRNIG